MSKAYKPRQGTLNFEYKQVKSASTFNSLIYAVKAGMVSKNTEIDKTVPCTLLQIPEHIVFGYCLYLNQIKIKTFSNFSKLKDFLKQNPEKYKINYLVKLNLGSVKSLSFNKPIFRQICCNCDFQDLIKTDQDLTNKQIQHVNSQSFIDVTSVTKGKGFSGVIKKYGLKVKKRKHARANKTRHVGASGSRGFGYSFLKTSK